MDLDYVNFDTIQSIVTLHSVSKTPIYWLLHYLINPQNSPASESASNINPMLLRLRKVSALSKVTDVISGRTVLDPDLLTEFVIFPHHHDISFPIVKLGWKGKHTRLLEHFIVLSGCV